MRNPSHRLLYAAALLIVPVGCQSPLRPNETADLKPRDSLLGEPFDEDAARAKVRARQLGRQNSETIASTQPPSNSGITQTGFRSNSPIDQTADEQQQARSQQSQTPEAIQQHIRQGSEAMARQDWSNATFHYEAILSTDSRNPLAHQMLGRIGDQTQRFESAEYHYLRALSERPQDPNLLSDLGYSYLQQGQFQKAKGFLLRSLGIDPDHQMAKANLAAVEAYSGNVDAALALLKQISSEQEAHQTLHELLNRPAPAQRRDQQLLGQQLEELPVGEQMRIARERSRDERARREAREALELRERIRLAMKLGGPLNNMGNGYADSEISDIIAQIQNEDEQANAAGRASQSQQFATGPQTDPRYGGTPQFGAPPQSGPPVTGLPPVPPNGNPNQNYYPAPNIVPAPGSSGEWSTQTIPWSPGSGTPQLQNPLYGDARGPGAQNLQPPNSQQQPMQNWQQPGQNSFPGNQSQWNGQPPQGQPHNQGYPHGANPAYPEQQRQWQTPPEQNLPPSTGQPTFPNPQQQFVPNSQIPENANQYQSFPNGQQQQYAPPGQFPTPPATSPPASGYNRNNQSGTGNNDFGAQYVPPSNSGVWSPQGGIHNSYGGQTGAIQQLGHQTPARQPGSGANNQARQDSMRQAMRLGMAAGPGSLIQMDGQSGTGNQSPEGAPQAQQFFPQGDEQIANSPSSAVWNSGSNGSRITSPNRNLWQTGPMPTDARNQPPVGGGNLQQWQQLPSAQQQPQSSTWNHQNQLPTGPMRSQNWSAAESSGNNWQSNSFGTSPTLNGSFAPAHMLDPNPARADTAPTMTTSFDQQGTPTTQNPGATRIPFTSRQQ